LAGSGLTLSRAVKNAVEMLDVDLHLAVKMASTNPANVLRIPRKGVIKEGYDADLVLMDKSCTVLKTWVEGKCCYNIGTETD
jgi:N-acetylglucosamine-6-phosphate deacetylase